MLTKERKTRKKRIRGKVAGSAHRPRLVVFRSNKFVYAQLVDDNKGVTLATAFGSDPKAVGGQLSDQAGKKKIKEVVFDRGGYKYHGKIKLVAESAREGGLKF